MPSVSQYYTSKIQILVNFLIYQQNKQNKKKMFPNKLDV